MALQEMCQSLIGKVQQQCLCCLFIYNISFLSDFQSFFSKKSVNLFWHYRCKVPVFKHFYFCENHIQGWPTFSSFRWLFGPFFACFSRKILLTYKSTSPRSLIFSHFQRSLAFEEVDRLFLIILIWFIFFPIQNLVFKILNFQLHQIPIRVTFPLQN